MMLPVTQLNKLQKDHLDHRMIEAACFPKQEVIDLLELIKNDANIPFVKVFLVQHTIEGQQRVSMAMIGGIEECRKQESGQGIVSDLPCPPYCPHGTTSNNVAPAPTEG